MKLPVDLHLDRRDIVRGGVLLGLASLLQGCVSQTAEVLPSPIWPKAPTPPVYAKTTPLPPAAPSAIGVGYYALPPEVMARSRWTQQPLNVSRLTANGSGGRMGQVTRITIHHDALDSNTVRSAGDAVRRLNTIRQGHMSRRPEPFADIGYHYIIDPLGQVWEGRPLAYQGAHVAGQNENNMGVMVMGNFDYQRPTSATMQSLEAFVCGQMRRFNIQVNRVRTHQELAQTACPGRNLQRSMLASRGRGGNLARA